MLYFKKGYFLSCTVKFYANIPYYMINRTLINQKNNTDNAVFPVAGYGGSE